MIQGVKLSGAAKEIVEAYSQAGVFDGMKESVERDGVTVAVLPNGFSCTVGMAKHGLPDMILFSGGMKHLTVFLHHLALRLVAEKTVAEQGLMNISATDKELNVYIDQLELDDVAAVASPIIGFYKHCPDLIANEASFVQVMWYDNDGRYPIHAEYDQVRSPQKMVNPTRNVRVQ